MLKNDSYKKTEVGQNSYKPGINTQGISLVLTIFLIIMIQRCKLLLKKKIVHKTE